MDWAIDFIETPSKENMRMVRETLDARHQSERGHHAEAARILWELTVHARHAGDTDWECITLVHLGKVYRVLRWSIAVKQLELALALARQSGFELGAMMALNELGEMYCSWGQLKESVAALEEALGLVSPDDPASRRDVLLNLEVAHEGLGNHDVVCALLEEVVQIDRELDRPELPEDQERLAEAARLAATTTKQDDTTPATGADSHLTK